MQSIQVNAELIIPAEYVSISYVRDLADGGAQAARHLPTAVELRLDVPRCPCFSAEEKERIVAYSDLAADRRGTVKVSCSEFHSRARNLREACRLLAEELRKALSPRPEPAPEAPVEERPAARPRRGRGVGLRKRPRD